MNTVDYNSWIESDKGRRLAASLDKDTILAEGYKEYDTGRTYLVKLGDWRKDKDEEVELDGIGGVNILVKADVHRSGTLDFLLFCCRTVWTMWSLTETQASTSQPTPSRTRPRRKDSPKWPSALDTRWSDCPTMSSGTSTPRRSLVISETARLTSDEFVTLFHAARASI